MMNINKIMMNQKNWGRWAPGERKEERRGRGSWFHGRYATLAETGQSGEKVKVFRGSRCIRSAKKWWWWFCCSYFITNSLLNTYNRSAPLVLRLLLKHLLLQDTPVHRFFTTKKMFTTILLLFISSCIVSNVSCQTLRGQQNVSLTRRPAPGHDLIGDPPGGPDPCPLRFGNFFEFIYEGSPNGGCETMSFNLLPWTRSSNTATLTTTEHLQDEGHRKLPITVTYSHSLAGLGNDVLGNENIGLTASTNPVLYNVSPNYAGFIFVAKATIEADDGPCYTYASKCLLRCVPGARDWRPTDPPLCENV